ncbi:uncharacterized protein LOC126657165 [Mercurialis annua]|uniref:uncharacterized protein LOC126657165 n=1 Tax=Mercurialis annua TaxID=3986 RepID=UPI00215E0BC1|nr:uncharacterized protein LOC126657165 [Mercurialis annua]
MLWIKLGDLNTKFFHRSIKQRQTRKRIVSLSTPNGNITDPEEIKNEFLTHYKNFIEMTKPLGQMDSLVLFFKRSWNIVGQDVCIVVKEFFQNGKLLNQVNSTSIVLIPKVQSPNSISDYRTIACSDNVLMAHEIIRNYHRGKGDSCSMKVDIQKAYDSLAWDFIEEVLIGFRFPNQFIAFIMKCIRSAKFNIIINGEESGYFAEGRSLRQGTPSLPCCKSLKISHLAFADDLFLFSNGDLNSISILKNTLSEFSNMSGLYPNLNKSFVYFDGVNSVLRNDILSFLGFKHGSLPVKYLGLPLLTTRLSGTNCNEMISKISSRVSSWAAKSLSYTGRLQLINDVIMSMHIYWSSIFILPSSVISGVERICRRFLWNGSDPSKNKSLVSWKDGICKSADCSWSWRNLLKIRNNVKPYFEYILGKGDRFSFWHDPWMDGASIVDRFPLINIKDADVHKEAKVCNLWKNGEWSLLDPMDNITQTAWDQVSKFKIEPDREDRVNWKIEKNKAFSVRSLYHDMTPNTVKVDWYKLVWYKGYIPRGKETLEHLFFSCNFSLGIWKKALRDMGLDRPAYPWNREVSFFIRRTSGRSSDSKVRKVMCIFVNSSMCLLAIRYRQIVKVHDHNLLKGSAIWPESSWTQNGQK